MMNGISSRLTTLEIVAIFILSLFFFMGGTAGQSTLDPAPASLSSGRTTPLQTAASNYHLTIQPPSDWALFPR